MFSATKPITSHEAVWPCQGQPCSAPGSLPGDGSLSVGCSGSDHELPDRQELAEAAGALYFGSCRAVYWRHLDVFSPRRGRLGEMVPADGPTSMETAFDRAGQGRGGADRALGSGTPRAADLARPAAP